MSHYYDQKVDVKSNINSFSVTINDITLKFLTDNGVFSKKYLDYGTKVLLENYRESDLHAPILDMCSGYGPIGIYLSKISKENIYMAEINERAYKLSLENIKINKSNITAYNSDLFEKIPIDLKFKDIITNPPIRAGKDTVFKIYEESFMRLIEDGSLWVVIQKKQGAPSTIKKLESLFNQVTVVKKDSGYYIIKAQK